MSTLMSLVVKIYTTVVGFTVKRLVIAIYMLSQQRV